MSTERATTNLGWCPPSMPMAYPGLTQCKKCWRINALGLRLLSVYYLKNFPEIQMDMLKIQFLENWYDSCRLTAAVRRWKSFFHTGKMRPPQAGDAKNE
ncbi:hypothetical protein [Desulfatibacillum aliphaticivorans]|uniref:hypothetical protein n=1 Tax=Desulfatibacillum aliphaticivorans TaxID=218208 RepID=UPI0012FA969F|nr:hypothetical protein [Desulfatibacillum aliphaticivorans]